MSRLLLFVCSGNTCRSPMAAAIARAEIAADASMPSWPVGSAGVAVSAIGAPISPDAAAALAELRIEAPADHQARLLTPQLCASSEAVFCMTRAQRDAIAAMVPQAAERIFCLDPAADVPDPAGHPFEAYRSCARRLQELVRAHLAEQRERHALSETEAADHQPFRPETEAGDHQPFRPKTEELAKNVPFPWAPGD